MATHARKIPLFPILSVNFIGTLGFSIVLPFLIFVVTRFGGNAIIYGLLGATYSAFQLVGAPILGRWSDIYGRRKVLLLSQAGTLISWSIFLIAMYLPVEELLALDSDLLGAFTLTLPLLVLFLARALDGITGGNVSVANAYLADITDEKHRSQNFGKMAAAANLGFIFGPAIAGLLGATAMGEKLPILMAMFISVTAVVMIFFFLPESRPRNASDSANTGSMHKVMGQECKDCYSVEEEGRLPLKAIIRLPHIPVLLSMYFLVMLGFNLFYVAFPVDAVQRLNWELIDTGTFFSFMGLMMVIVQGPVLGQLTKVLVDQQLLRIGSFLLAASFLLYLFGNTVTTYAAAALLALGNGVMWPSLLSILSGTVASKQQGAIQGLAGSIGSLASIIGLLVGGFLYQQLAEYVFVLSGIVIAVVFLLSIRPFAGGERS